MPLVHVAMRKGRLPGYRAAILQGIYEALRATFDVPKDDRFMVLSEHDEPDFLYGKSYLGIERSDDVVMIQLTVSATRTAEQKKALFAAIAAKLTESPGLRPEDVFINLVEVKTENWSFGHGVAQYAT